MRRYSAIAFLIVTLITPSASFGQQPAPQQTFKYQLSIQTIQSVASEMKG
jgi:hypothetical protein